MENVLTIDLEEWFVVEALRGQVDQDDWDDLPSTVIENTFRLLSILDRHDVLATFFVLGWVAERHPTVIREIANQGHEIACHSYAHRRVDSMSPDEFREDTARSMHAISEAADERVVGYRAPSWSINQTTPWAFDVLAELGFEYDSSIFPIKHDLYGVPDGPRHTFRMTCNGGRVLWEIPATTFRVLGRNVPAAGGGFFRHSPYWYSRRIIRMLNRQGQPAIFYIHPWEFDPDPPRMQGLSLVQRFRSYGSTSLLEMKVSRMLDDFEFVTLREYLHRHFRTRIGFHQTDTFD